MLSDRLGILNRGKLLCIGTPYDLEKKYGNSLQIELTFTKGQYTEAGKDYVIKEFEGELLLFDLDTLAELKENKLFIWTRNVDKVMGKHRCWSSVYPGIWLKFCFHLRWLQGSWVSKKCGNYLFETIFHTW